MKVVKLTTPLIGMLVFGQAFLFRAHGHCPELGGHLSGRSEPSLRDYFKDLSLKATASLLGESTERLEQFQSQAPQVGASVKAAMQELYAVTHRMDPGDFLGPFELAKADFIQAAAADPYLSHLGTFAIGQLAFLISFNGPGGLAPDLALVSVQSEFDAQIPQRLKISAETLLQIRKLREIVLIWQSQLRLGDDPASLRWWESLAPTITFAQSKLAKLKVDIVAKRGDYFPQSSYLKMFKHITDQDPLLLNLMQKIASALDQMTKTRTSRRIPRIYENQFKVPLVQIAELLELPARYDVFDFYQHFETATFRFHEPLSYERFLILGFNDDAEKSAKLDEVLQFLNTIIDFYRIKESEDWYGFFVKRYENFSNPNRVLFER